MIGRVTPSTPSRRTGIGRCVEHVLRANVCGLRVILAALAVLAMSLQSMSASATGSENLASDFMMKAAKCRVAIETSSELDISGMLGVKPSASLAKAPYTTSAWRDIGSDIVITMQNWTDQNGKVRRICSVMFADDQRRLSSDQQAYLVRAFLTRRAELVAKLTHTSSDPDPVYPLVALGFSPVVTNPNGCKVITAFFVDPSGSFFNLSTGEQAIHPCDAGGR